MDPTPEQTHTFLTLLLFLTLTYSPLNCAHMLLEHFRGNTDGHDASIIRQLILGVVCIYALVGLN